MRKTQHHFQSNNKTFFTLEIVLHYNTHTIEQQSRLIEQVLQAR